MIEDIDLSQGIELLWQKDSEYQLTCLEGIIRNIRDISDDNILQMHVDYLRKQGAFFVHNDAYMQEYFGLMIKEPRLGIYRYNHCSLAGRLAIPIRLMNGHVKGFIGYSKKPKDWPEEEGFIKYLYPPKDSFAKERYFYLAAEEYKKSVADGYICIVDGIFDKIILSCLGVNAVSLCGSALTRWHRYYLKFIKRKIVIADNDIAGRNLAYKCKMNLENCVELIQSKSSDIDGLLRTQDAVDTFKSTFGEMQNEGFILSHYLSK